MSESTWEPVSIIGISANRPVAAFVSSSLGFDRERVGLIMPPIAVAAEIRLRAVRCVRVMVLYLANKERGHSYAPQGPKFLSLIFRQRALGKLFFESFLRGQDSFSRGLINFITFLALNTKDTFK